MASAFTPSFNELRVRQRLHKRPPVAEQDLAPERRKPLELTEVMDAQLPGPRLQEQPNLAAGPRHPLSEVPKPSTSLLSQFSPCLGELHEKLVAHRFPL